MRNSVIATFAMLLACSVAGAQMRGGASAAHMASSRGRSAGRMSPNYSGISRGNSLATSMMARSAIGTSMTSFQGARQAMVIRILPNGRVTSSFTPLTNSVSFGSQSGVPGLGFDFPHLAAVGGSAQNNRSLGFGRGGRRGQGAYVPILFGGYPYYDYGPYYDSGDYDQAQQSVQSQPQVIVIQQPGSDAAEQQGADSANDAALPPPTAAPVPDIGDFILVRQDGRILFASAFSVVGTQMQYVSPDGIRHTLPMTELDANATQQMNEARGTTVQLSN